MSEAGDTPVPGHKHKVPGTPVQSLRTTQVTFQQKKLLIHSGKCKQFIRYLVRPSSPDEGAELCQDRILDGRTPKKGEFQSSEDVQTHQVGPMLSHMKAKVRLAGALNLGLSNPFRGLLKLGHLERRGAMGMWHYYYCELSPFEFRLYIDAEDRICCDTCSLLRCEEACITTPEGRFELAFSGKRLHLRAANCDEAEDWLDRIVEAVNKCRPAPLLDDQWVVLQASTIIDSARPEENAFVTVSSTLSVSSSPKQEEEATFHQAVVEYQFPLPTKLDWSRPTEPESDSVKEAVLYFSVDPESCNWVPFVFSLTLEALKGFQLHEGRKVLHSTHPIEGIRDVVPAVSLGGPAFFKVLTSREILKLRAENPKEARSWRTLIREALNSYLESGTDSNLKESGVVTHEVLSNSHRLLQHRLKGNGVLLVHLGSVPSENGLDAQSFKCAGCPKPIGTSLGRVRLCEFSGQYYCDCCHQGNTSIIPSRMVHNWDLTPREISIKAFKLLAQIGPEPLLHIDHLNPELCNHAESMAKAKNLRQRLCLLGDYLLTCSSGVCKKVQTRLDQRTYLLESSHLYSVQDLQQIAEGQYEAFLNPLILFGTNHVHHCDLCTQRGFICQICHSEDIIFPFQFDKTIR
ncbi:pleckstrin homology domain-containing family M member 1 [Aplochiton taeniatus]